MKAFPRRGRIPGGKVPRRVNLQKTNIIPTPAAVLGKYWGFPHFRPLQAEIIDAVLNDSDVLALLPTGGGKSLCYQVPGLCRPGICLVVSPLIALMKDQVRQLQSRGIDAVALHSGLSAQEMDRQLDNCSFGQVRFLYVSPERLLTERFLGRLASLTLNLIAVDEAHCVSQWGYDFRPAYLNIVSLREHFPGIPVLALTATATTEVAEDISGKLGLRKPIRFQASFSRENLSLVVRHTTDKETECLRILEKIQGSAILYVRNRKKTRELAIYLQARGISAAHYHAGLEIEERNRLQDAWIANQVRVMVTTNAFGMGIDKSDVRLVIHWELPDNPEAYYQEAGRAGRDGQSAYAVLLFQTRDGQHLERYLAQAYPDLAIIKQVYLALANYLQLASGSMPGESFDFDFAAFCAAYRFEQVITFNCLNLLAREGWLFLSESVNLPASFHIRVNREQLYDFQLRHIGMEPLLKSLLRMGQGAFQDFAQVHERKLGEFLGISVEKVRAQLHFLHQQQILHYRPQREKPQLQFLRERAVGENFYIDTVRYQFLRDRARLRLEAMLAYATEPRCRMQQLVMYFGEVTSQPCGRCDHCREHRRGKKLPNMDAMSKFLLDQLREGPLPIHVLVEPWHGASREALIEFIHHWLEDGRIVEKDGLVHLSQPSP